MINFLLAVALILTCFIWTQAQRAKSILLTGKEAESLAHQCSRPSPKDFTGVWEPSKDQIAEMESKFNDISKLKADSCCIKGARIDKLGDWYMQYAALIWHGKKIIYISAISRDHPVGYVIDPSAKTFRTEPSDAWKTDAEIICDGGTG